MNKMIIEENLSKQKQPQRFRSRSPKITKEIQNKAQTPIKQTNLTQRITQSYNQLSESNHNGPPYQCDDDPKIIELGLQPKPTTKRKKDWRSWSSQEKIHFYEIIANGGNYSSLQKLFKTMNDKIGTKSTEKIRDYYYRMLKNVNTLLKSAGEMGLNSKNRDEVILAIGCYGKLLNSSSKKYKLDMKKLNKHPRLFKRIANTLKKLITKQIKMVRTKKINNLSSSGNKSTKQKTVTKNANNTSNNIPRQTKPSSEVNKNEQSDFTRVINVTAFRNIPYEAFVLRITPYDKETYLKMIMENYCPRIEINVPISKPLKYIIDILTEKWKNIPQNNAKNVLYLLPLEEIWLPKQLTQFSALDNSSAFDMGDIYTSYGNPSTNILYMYYQWVQVKNDSKAQLEIINNLINRDGMIDNGSNKNRFFSNMNENQDSNCAIKNDHSFEVDISDEDEEEDEQEQEKSFMPLESDLNIFDPLEFLGFEDDKKNSSEEEEDPNIYNNNNNHHVAINHLPNKNIFITKKSARHKNISKSSVESTTNNNNNPNNHTTTNNNNNNLINNNQSKNNNNSKLRTDYSELFSRSEGGLMLTNKSNQNNNSNLDKVKTAKRKIPFSNNVNKEDIPISRQFNTSLRNLHLMSNKSSSVKEHPIDSNDFNNTIKDKERTKEYEEIKTKELNINNQEPEKEQDRHSLPKPKWIHTPNKQPQSATIHYNNNLKQNSMLYPSNFGLSALFQPDQNTKMNNNNNYNDTNMIENNNPDISNLLNQNSINYNSIFDYGDNNNTNIDMFKQNFNSTNIYKMEYQNNNSNNYPLNNNNNNQLRTDQKCKEKLEENEEKIDKDDTKTLLNKKKKRNKEKPKREKITIEEIEESEKKQRMKKIKNTLIQQSPSSCIINHNNYFNFPGQYYPQLNTSNIGIPKPSIFFKEQNNNETNYQN